MDGLASHGETARMKVFTIASFAALGLIGLVAVKRKLDYRRRLTLVDDGPLFL